MTLQAELASDLWSARVGQTTEALLLGPEPGRTTIWHARTPWQAPEVDGQIRVRGRGEAGSWVAGARHRRRGVRPRGEDRLIVSSSSWHRVLYPGLLLFGLSLPLSKSASNVLLGVLYLSAIAGALYSKEFRDDVIRNCRQPLTAALALFCLVAYVGIIHTENYADGFSVANKFVSLPAIYFLVSVLLQSDRSEEAGARKAESLLLSFLAGLAALNLLGVLTFLGVVGDAAFALPLAPLGMHHIWYSNLNALGLYTAASLLLFTRHGTSARGRSALGGFLLLSALCILLSTSRTAWFGVALTAAIMAAVTDQAQKDDRCSSLLLSALAIAAVYRFVPLVHDRVNLVAQRHRPVLRRPPRGVLHRGQAAPVGSGAF